MSNGASPEGGPSTANLPPEVQAAIQSRQTPHESTQGTVDAIATTGHVATVGVLAYGVGAAAVSGGMAAVGCFASAVLAPMAVAMAGAAVASMVGADDWLLDVTGAERLAGQGPNVATVGHKIAHSFAFAGALGAIAAGVLVGAAVVFVIGTGGLGAILVGAAVGGFVGGAVAGAGAKAADVTGEILSGSPNVFAEGMPVARMTDIVACSRHPWEPPPQIIEGSATIFVNNLPMARIGHKIACAAVVQEGCETVFGDDTTVSNGEADAEFEWWQQAILSAVEVLGAVSATRKDGLLGSFLRRKAGEPVDMVTGDYADERTDFEYPSVLALRLTRVYAGRQRVAGLLGDRWICNWSQRLVFPADEPGTAIFEDHEGQRLAYALNPPSLGSSHGVPEQLNSVNLRAPYYHLRGSASQPHIYDRRNQQILVFALVPLMPGDDEKPAQVTRLIAIEDRNGNRIEFDYDGEHLRRVRHSDGVCFNVATTDDGRMLQIEREGQVGPIVRYGYETDGPQRLSMVDGLYTGQFRYCYTSEGWLRSWQDNGVTRLDLDYDALGRVIATRTPEGVFNDRFEYDPVRRVNRYIDACGGVTQFHYDDNNLVTQEVDPLGQSTHTEWSALEHKLSSIDAFGRRSRYEHNELGLCSQITDHLGQISSFEYNKQGQLTVAKSPSGEEQRWLYDERGNLLEHRDNAGVLLQYAYDKRGRLLEQRTIGQSGVLDPHSSAKFSELSQRFEYNQLGHCSAVLDATGRATRYERDGWGRPLRITDALGNCTRLHYEVNRSNPRAALSRVEHSDGGIEQFQYDAEGQLSRHIGALGQTHQYHHGAFDTLRVHVDAGGYRTEYHRDNCNRLSQIVNALRQTWSFEYDLAGRLIGEKDWAGRYTQYRHDALGRLISKTLCDGSEHRYSYDDSDRLTRVEAGEWALSYQYDVAGRLVQADNERKDPATSSFERQSTVGLEYNAQGQLVAEEQDGQRIEYRYDALGRLQQRDSASGTSRYGFDALGSLEQLQSNGHVLQMQHNALGQETLRLALSAAVPGSVPGFALHQHYDSRQRLTGQRVEALASPMASGLTTAIQAPMLERQYQWDPSSRLVGVSDKNLGQTRYRYDATDQVRQVLRDVVHATGGSPSALGQESYSYNALQNIAQSQFQAQGGITAHSYQKDAVAQIGDSRYEYDTRGRTIRKTQQVNGYRPKEWQYEWDDFDRLISVRTPEGSLWQYRYDAFGRRVEKRCLNPQNLKGAGHGQHRRTRDRVLSTPHRTRSLWQGGQIVEQWRSFRGEGENSETVQIDRWHFELSGQNFKPLAKESLLPQDANALENAEDQLVLPEISLKSLFYPVVSDHLGTPKEMYNLRGECVWQAQHELWGRAHIRKAKQYSEHKALTTTTPHSYTSDEDFALPGIDCELRFAGQWEDAESGLHFNFNRYYDPGSGQYLSQDPIGLEGGLRTHGYVADPLGWIDPWGLAGCSNRDVITRGPNGQILSVKGQIRPGDLGKGTGTNAASRAWAKLLGRATDDAGHTRGSQLGGNGGKPYVFPQNPNVNRGRFQKFEGEVADYVRTTGRPVDFEQTYHYGNGGTRPTGVTYSVTDGGVPILGGPRTFPN